jgi:signal transduction histidine kinase
VHLDHRNLPRDLSVFLIFIVGLAFPAKAVDQIQIQDTRAESYLPYRVEEHYGAGTEGDRVLMDHICQVYQVGHGDATKAAFVTGYNRLYSEDLPADISVWLYPKQNYLDEHPINLQITDYGFYRDGRSGHRGLVGGGYRHDSAFAFTFVPKDTLIQYVPLAHGKDSTGDGQWRGRVSFMAAEDYDFDGVEEVFFHVDPGRDGSQGVLICFDPIAGRVRWSVPLSSFSSRGSVISSRDSLHPSVFVVTYGQGGNRRDSLFSSQYGYLAEIDSSGRVLSHKIITKFGEPASMIISPDDTCLFVINTVPFADSPEEANLADSITYLSKLSRHGVLMASIPRPGREATPWFGSYGQDKRPDIFTISYNGSVSVYDQDLHLRAESDPTSLRGYRCTLPNWGDADSVMLFGSPRGFEVFTRDFRKLAVIPGNWSLIQPLAYDSNGRLLAICVTDSRNYMVANVMKRSLGELISVAYFDYQIYILSTLLSLAVGLVVMNLFRRSLSRHSRALALSNQQLAEAHTALKDAQATIISQEKFRQAKDIAGAFAHEIRNALFPADSALTKLAQLRRAVETDPERVDRLEGTVRNAVTRAISITQEISSYTKLDSEYAPERVNLKSVVDDLVKAHGELLDDRGIRLRVEPSEEVAVRSNSRQLMRVLSNLLLNSIDALAGKPDPEVVIQWRRDGEDIILLSSDNGSGITSENLGRVFDAFFSTKPIHGTGIGLAMSKKIIEMYGGTITVRSEENVRTSFTITLTPAGEGS